jgi:hypothetical protein
MTKKHFIDLADTLFEVHERSDMPQYDWDMLVNEMVRFCKRNGPNFSEGTFRDYLDTRISAAQL